MKKVMCIGVICLCLLGAAWADKIVIAPILYISEQSQRSEDKAGIDKQILGLLNSYWLNGAVHFALSGNGDVKTVQTVQQAMQVCSSEKCDYLIYGYVRQTDSYCFVELRLFNPNNQMNRGTQATPVVEQRFYAADDILHFDRMLSTAAEKIYTWMCKRYAVSSDSVPEEKTTFTLRLPFSVGYWTPAGAEWARIVLGTFQLNAGAELYPELDLPVMFNLKHNLSIRLDVNYRFGITMPETVPGFYHDIVFRLPVFYNVSITDRHGVSVGVGPLYAVSILSVQQKYEKYSTFLTSHPGLGIEAEYRYAITPEFTLTAGLTFDFYFSANTNPVFSPRIGILYTAFEKEVRK